jgi:hypothetical protein
MINVTKTFFPPIEDYQAKEQRIWDNQWLTNNGKLYKELSHKLIKYLGVNKKLTMIVHSHFFKQVSFYFDAQITDGRKLHFRAKDVIAFTVIQGGVKTRPMDEKNGGTFETKI